MLFVDLIVRARLVNEPEAHVAASVDGKHYPGIRFGFNVLEVLKGTYDDKTLHGIWVRFIAYDTRDDARARSMKLIAQRDARWDDREAVLFLSKARNNTMGPDFLSAASHYSLGFGSEYYTDQDGYSLNSRRGRRTWLPASNTGGQGADREFLLTPPRRLDRSQGSATSTPPLTDSVRSLAAVLERRFHPDGVSITLGKLKKLIGDVLAEYNGGDGSEEYKECVDQKYRHLFYARNWPVTRGVPYATWEANQTIDSGQPANTIMSSREYRVPSEWDYEVGDTIPPIPFNRFLGRDAHLFTIGTTPARTYRSGSNDLEYDEVMQTVRPLPTGVYEFTLERRAPALMICNFIISEQYTITVAAFDYILHELFFDPVTSGKSVAADAANGVLEPATFTGANGGTAMLESISWESGVVKIEADPHDALGGHVLDFIELDGTVPLALDVFDAMVEGANGTLSWAVSSQPWADGDKLMVRIRKPLPSCRSRTVIPGTGSEPWLEIDCENLLDLKGALAGMASLNWSLDTPMASWDGVTVGGTPRRVTGLDLRDRGLSGVVPSSLGALIGLERLTLSGNRLTGAIPLALEGLNSLETLHLSGNSFTGCIPSVLRDIEDSDLDLIELTYC